MGALQCKPLAVFINEAAAARSSWKSKVCLWTITAPNNDPLCSADVGSCHWHLCNDTCCISSAAKAIHRLSSLQKCNRKVVHLCQVQADQTTERFALQTASYAAAAPTIPLYKLHNQNLDSKRCNRTCSDNHVVSQAGPRCHCRSTHPANASIQTSGCATVGTVEHCRRNNNGVLDAICAPGWQRNSCMTWEGGNSGVLSLHQFGGYCHVEYGAWRVLDGYYL